MQLAHGGENIRPQPVQANGKERLAIDEQGLAEQVDFHLAGGRRKLLAGHGERIGPADRIMPLRRQPVPPLGQVVYVKGP